MTDQNYIRKAVELADGWTLIDNQYIETCSGYKSTVISDDEIRDALAAQLVRQLDELSDNRVNGFYSRPLQADVYWPGLGYKQCGYAITCGKDRTMNTIKAIVESGVLQRQNADA